MDGAIRALLVEARKLSAEQVRQAVQLQEDKGLHFGDAVVELGFASRDDVLVALGRHFQYPTADTADNPLRPELVALNEPFSVQAESLRAIRTQLVRRLCIDGRAQHALAVVSPSSGDGRSFCSANLAVSLAQLGGRTLLVDADLRRPRLHRLFSVRNACGLSDLLGSALRPQAAVQHVPGIAGLGVITAGLTPPNPLELVERAAFAALMTELLAQYDYVVVDTPALQLGSDATVIASHCGAALVVARKGRASVAQLQGMVADLTETPAQMLGVVFNAY